MPELDSSVEGHDAVCFTAGIAGAPFAAGTIHAYLAARRVAPKIAAGISMGALSAAAMQRCYEEIHEAKPEEKEAARWAWFRQYVMALSDDPLRVIWDGVPNQSDFFADVPPLRDTSAPAHLKQAEGEARRQLHLLVKLGCWLGHLPASVKSLAHVLIAYVRFQEKYPGPKPWRALKLGWYAFWFMFRVFGHIFLAPDCHRVGRVAKDGTFYDLRLRPLLGWTFYLFSSFLYLSTFQVILAMLRLLHLSLPSLARKSIGSATVWALEMLRETETSDHFRWMTSWLQGFVGALAGLYDAHFWQVTAFCATCCVLSWAILIWILTSAERRREFFAGLAGELDLGKGIIHDYYLLRQLTRLFDPENKERVNQRGIQPTILLVAAPLQPTYKSAKEGWDESVKPIVTQLWAATGAPLVYALRTALALPPVFAPTHLERNNPEANEGGQTIDHWVSPSQSGKTLDVVDGSVIRQNPLPALFDFLKKNAAIGESLARHNSKEQPAIHVVYNAPFPPSDTGRERTPLPEEKANIVDVGLASIELARRRDTRLEVFQTNFISELETRIAGLGGAQQQQTGKRPPLAIFADEIAPEGDLDFANPLSPKKDDLLKVVAQGCRRTLAILYTRQLGGLAGGSDEVPCSQLFPILAQPSGKTPGLPEVCTHCTGKIAKPSGKPQVETVVSERIPSANFPQLTGEEPRIVFVASGGVFRGAFHIGMLAALRNCGICPDLVVGASVGTLMGGALAAMSRVDEAAAMQLIGRLTDVFLHVDNCVALTKTLKGAARELGIRCRSIGLSPAKVRRMLRKGSRSDPGYAATGAPPAVIDAISDLFLIPHRKTGDIAAEFIAGHVTTATNAFFHEVKQETLGRLRITDALMGVSLLEPVAAELLGQKQAGIDLHRNPQPYQTAVAQKVAAAAVATGSAIPAPTSVDSRRNIAFFATATDLGSRSVVFLGREDRFEGAPYDFVQAVLSSSAFPCVFAPRRESDVFPGRGLPRIRYADGGMFDNLPFIPAIEILSRIQCDYRQTAGQNHHPIDFLKQRADNPDLFIAGSLNARAENDKRGEGPFNDLLSVFERALSLQDNVKIRSFQFTSEKIQRQMRRIVAASPSPSGAGPHPVDKLLDGIVNAAVLPVFPTDRDHLNGTFAFCASVGLDRDTVRKSIADGCYQTLKTFAQTQAYPVGLAGEAMRKLVPQRIPVIRMSESGQTASEKECPYFRKSLLDSEAVAPFQCPFTKAGEQFPDAVGVYRACVEEQKKRREAERAG